MSQLRFEKGTKFGLSVGDDDEFGVEPSKDASQTNPKGSYVYGHYSKSGMIFYIGIGVGRRAWDTGRHYIWKRYVDKHLGGEFKVVILADGLSPEEAEYVESRWVAQETPTLVNWVNFGRPTDLKATEKFHKLRRKNLEQVDVARSLETNSPDRAVKILKKCLADISEYAFLKLELGLVGTLVDEELEENGYKGELNILDRLTLVLCKLGKGPEAQEIAREYFETYRADASLAAAARILKRVEKAAK